MKLRFDIITENHDLKNDAMERTAGVAQFERVASMLMSFVPLIFPKKFEEDVPSEVGAVSVRPATRGPDASFAVVDDNGELWYWQDGDSDWARHEPGTQLPTTLFINSAPQHYCNDGYIHDWAPTKDASGKDRCARCGRQR